VATALVATLLCLAARASRWLEALCKLGVAQVLLMAAAVLWLSDPWLLTLAPVVKFVCHPVQPLGAVLAPCRSRLVPHAVEELGLFLLQLELVTAAPAVTSRSSQAVHCKRTALAATCCSPPDPAPRLAIAVCQPASAPVALAGP
jgi:hypothetical protein